LSTVISVAKPLNVVGIISVVYFKKNYPTMYSWIYRTFDRHSTVLTPDSTMNMIVFTIVNCLSSIEYDYPMLAKLILKSH